MTGEMVIEARGLTKRFGKVVALDDVDLNIPTGSAFGLLGPSGAGKSTIVRLLAGLARQSAGTLEIGGAPAGSIAARRGLGVLLQDAQLYQWMTGRETLAFAADLAGVPGSSMTARIDAIAEQHGLGDLLGRRVATLPIWSRARLAIAQALVADPGILVLDEPFQWLDPGGRESVLRVLRGLRGARTIVLSAHVEADIEAVCDRVAILEAGRIVRTGAVVRAAPQPRAGRPAAPAQPRTATRTVVEGLAALVRAALRDEDDR